jgi:hypothetical protein
MNRATVAAIRHAATRDLFSTRLVEACSMGRVYIARDGVPIRTGAVPPRRKLRPVAIRRNPSFDVFNVRLLVALDKMLREKRRYQGDLSASINDALLGVDLNTVKLWRGALPTLPLSR